MLKSSCVSTTFNFNGSSSVVEVVFKGHPEGDHIATFLHSALQFRVYADVDGVITVYRKRMDLEGADRSPPFDFSVGLSRLNIAEAVHYQGHLSSIEDDDTKCFQVERDQEYRWEMEEGHMRLGGSIVFYFVPEYQCSGFIEVEWTVVTSVEEIREGLWGLSTDEEDAQRFEEDMTRALEGIDRDA